MSDILKLEIETISNVHIITIIISLIAFMMIYMKTNRDHAVKAFLVMQGSMILWMVFKVFKTVAPTELLRWYFIVAYYACVCIIEIAFLEFGYALYKKKRIPGSIRMLLYLFPLIQFIVILTNPYHHLFYSRYDFFGDSFGIMFYVHFFIEYVFIVVGCVYCGLTLRKHFRYNKIMYRVMLSIAILFPLVMNLLYVSKVFHKYLRLLDEYIIFDITPIVFTWSALLFVYATFKHDFFNVSPIMRHEIIHKLDTPILLLDSAFDIIYQNEKLEDMTLGLTDETIKTLINDYKCIGSTDEIEIIYDDRHLRVLLKKITSLIETEYIMTFKDVSGYRTLEYDINEELSQLEVSNDQLSDSIVSLKALSKVGARNYVARELHDIIGHSLVVTIKLLEVSKLYHKKDLQMSLDALNNALQSLDLGVTDIKKIKHDEVVVYSGDRLQKELYKILDHVGKLGLETKLSFKGNVHKINEQVFEMTRKICTELVTNTLKHANASELFISVSLSQEQVNVMVIDNGEGNSTLMKGNGLIGIENRLKVLGGKLVINTSKNEGFMSKFIIPLNT